MLRFKEFLDEEGVTVSAGNVAVATPGLGSDADSLRKNIGGKKKKPKKRDLTNKLIGDLE